MEGEAFAKGEFTKVKKAGFRLLGCSLVVSGIGRGWHDAKPDLVCGL